MRADHAFLVFILGAGLGVLIGLALPPYLGQGCDGIQRGEYICVPLNKQLCVQNFGSPCLP